MTLRDYLTLLRRGWPVVLISTLLGIGIAAGATYAATPTYGATSTVVVTATEDGTAYGPARESGFATGWADTYAALVSTDSVIRKAAEAGGDDVDELRRVVSAAARPETPIIDIHATAGDPHEAAARADAIADTLVGQSDAIAPPGVGGSLELAIVSRAEVPQQPTSPRPLNNVAIGTVIGLALGVASLLVFQALDTRIRSAADLPAESRLGTVTSLPAQRARRGRAGQAVDLRLESFRHLRAHLQLTTSAGGCIAVAGVTSASDAHAMADQLARVLGEVGITVVVVDVDLRPSPGSRRRATPSDATPAGIADVLADTATLDDVIGPGASEGVSVISAGILKESSSQLLTTSAMAAVLDQLASRFAYVLLACPPMTERSESAVMAARSGSCLLVVESGMTRRADLLQALDLMEGVGVRPSIVAIDHVRRFEPVRDVRTAGARRPSPASAD